MDVSNAAMSLTKRGQTVATFARVHWPRLVIYARTSLYSCLTSAPTMVCTTTIFWASIIFGLIAMTVAIV